MTNARPSDGPLPSPPASLQSPPRALITGITGQDGAYLAQLLLSKGYTVLGGMRRHSQDETARLKALGILEDITLLPFDLAEPLGALRLLEAARPDEVYNLAAQSFVGASWETPLQTSDLNAMGVARMLEALRHAAPEARFYQASTSEMFGRVRATPQNEETPFHPRSPYGVAKAYGHFLTVNYRESHGLHASSGILFNHESPLRGPDFVTRKITLALAAIARGSRAPCALGNLDARRDWGFAGDYVEGMWRMVRSERADDYVLATGRAASIRDFAQLAARALDFDLVWEGEGLDEIGLCRRTGQTLITVSPAYFRPAEVDVLEGDASKARQRLGWAPRTDLEALAAMMARADYDRLGGGALSLAA
ncbi:MAG: GDP-mannose 4,6-dehydratase [Pseudomonadota bacterium]